MRKIRIIGLCSVVLVLGLTWTVSSKEASEEICIPTGSFTLKSQESSTAKIPGVDFPHSRHFNFACKTCHHTWEFDGPIQNCTAAGCHDLTEPPKKSGKDAPLAIRYYKSAFHQACIGCHQTIHRKNIKEEKKLRFSDDKTQIQNVGPVSCRDCHTAE